MSGYKSYKSKIGKIYKNHRYCFNEYKIKGDITEFYIKNRKGKIYTVIIDTINLKKINFKSWQISLPKKYINTKINKKGIYLHRFLLNAKDGNIVDHINRNPLDNRISNLRFCSVTENNRNRKFKGYSLDTSRNKYIVSLKINGHTKYIGRFNTVKEAIKARIKAEKLYYKEFAVIR